MLGCGELCFALIVLATVVALFCHAAMYGPQASFLAEMFPTKVRYSGASMGYQVAGILGGVALRGRGAGSHDGLRECARKEARTASTRRSGPVGGADSLPQATVGKDLRPEITLGAPVGSRGCCGRRRSGRTGP
jgi:hypothetical protein